MLIFIKPSKTSLIASIISEIDPAHDEGVSKNSTKAKEEEGSISCPGHTKHWFRMGTVCSE